MLFLPHLIFHRQTENQLFEVNSGWFVGECSTFDRLYRAQKIKIMATSSVDQFFTRQLQHISSFACNRYCSYMEKSLFTPQNVFNGLPKKQIISNAYCFIEITPVFEKRSSKNETEGKSLE